MIVITALKEVYDYYWTNGQSSPLGHVHEAHCRAVTRLSSAWQTHQALIDLLGQFRSGAPGVKLYVNLICTSKRNNRVELSHLRCLTVDQYVEADHRKCQPIILRKMHVHMCGIVPFLLLVRFLLSYIWGNKQYVSCHCL